MRDEKIDLSALTKEKGQQHKFIGQVQEVTKEASETKSETDMSLDKEGQEPSQLKRRRRRKQELPENVRVDLTTDNVVRLELLRFSDEMKFIPRSQIVNQIIEQYFEEHTEDLSASIQSILKNL
ncbi:hypothetical protein [Porphyromonas levii]|uniref:Uncharacterized protein n=1 Tax=Porphyromonas levii TaxID=28114 RepID=A0A4Y8WNN3_9PORP|nr:hypothetical protein [Porphyromonas levii]TFH93954.1 hypothetical protein E4P47_09550 [Porphyromonas levii]TFH96815.1 hypothetical protein E4P48_03505 [Porphyromonas levii]